MKKFLRVCSWLYFLVLVIACAAIQLDDGRLWPVTLFLFAPRWVIAAPLALLAPFSLIWDFRFLPVYLLHAFVIAVPLLGLQWSLEEPTTIDVERRLCLLSCNLGEGADDVELLQTLVRENDVDVIVLQECSRMFSEPLFEGLGWEYQQEANIAIASRFPMSDAKVLVRMPKTHYEAVVAVHCDLRLPVDRGDASVDAKAEANGPFQVVSLTSVHFPTFRPALEHARHFDASAGEAIVEMGQHYRSFVENVQGQLEQVEIPQIFAGDFNVPIESVYYREYWNRFHNAFEQAGRGFGFTKFTRFHGVRIDHVLYDGLWRTNRATVGPDLGGDHRPVIVEWELPAGP